MSALQFGAVAMHFFTAGALLSGLMTSTANWEAFMWAYSGVLMAALVLIARKDEPK